MKLLTKGLLTQLPPLYSQDEVADPYVIVKFFTPWTSWTWYATEASVYATDEDGNEVHRPLVEYVPGDDVLFFGLVDGLERELGYFTLGELESVRGPGGLAIERDRHYPRTLLSEVK